MIIVYYIICCLLLLTCGKFQNILGGYSHTLITRVCAAVQGMVFKPFCQEHGIDNTHFRSGTGCQIKASLE